MMRSVHGRIGLAAVVAVGIVGLTACPTTRQTRTVERSGFLGDYSQLREGGSGEAQLVYIKPGVPWARYDKMQIDPVTIWTSGDSSLANVSDAERQLLVDYLDASLRNSLGQSYTLVDRPEANTLRLRVAITDAKGARVALNTVSKIVPQLRVLTTVGGLASGTQVLVGRAGVEAELLDGVTDERLAAAVDRRAGTKALRGGVSTWADVQNAFDYWSDRLRTRLTELRQANAS
jgi:Protein of unknown function (DUF3313)